MGRGDDDDGRADSPQGSEEMMSASREAKKTATAGKKTPTQGVPRGHGDNEDDCDATGNRRQRRPSVNDKAGKASPLATTTFEDHLVLDEGDDDDDYGGDCVLPEQRRCDEYFLKGGGPPANTVGSIAIRF